MRRTTASLVALAVAGSLAGCGSEQPVGPDPGLSRRSGETRLLALYGRDDHRATREVRIPAGTARLRIRIDCIADDPQLLDVRIGVVGSGAGACGPTSHRSGYVGLSGKDFGRYGTQTVTVRAPRGSTWSVAVDAG